MTPRPIREPTWFFVICVCLVLGGAACPKREVVPEGYLAPPGPGYQREEWAGKSAQGERGRGRNWKLKCERKGERCGPES